MAFSFTTPQGDVLIVPDTSVNINVSSIPTGLALSGVIALVGEADEGPAWNDAGEDKLSNNSFGPTDVSRVIAKYGTGNIVDAFRGAVVPSSSNKVQGGPNRIIIAKVNSGSKANKTTADGHGAFVAKRAGQPGNLIYFLIQDSQLEAAPTTGQFSYAPSTSTASLALRVNGGAKQTLAISANETPTALASALTGLANINASGGTNRSWLGGGGQVASIVAPGGQVANLVLTAPTLFSVSPQVGDTIRIPTGSVLAGAGNANVGWYIVTAVSNTTTLAQASLLKITAGAPVAVASATISATPDNDAIDYSSMKIDNMSGRDRSILTGIVGQSITSVAVSSTLTMTLTAGQLWHESPAVGDIVYIPAGSAYQGAGNANIGWYSVLSTSNTSANASLSLARLSNGNPVSVGSTAIVAVSDVQDLDKQIKGDGKALEIYDNAGSVSVATELLQLGLNSAVPWLSTSVSPLLLTSSAELEKTISLVRSGTQESYTIGGNISLRLGYNGTTGSASINLVSGNNHLQTTVSGGSGSNLDLDLSKIPTINDLVNIINSNTGYKASAGSALEGQRSTSVLDGVSSIGIASELGSQPAEIKRDLYDLQTGPGSLASSQLAGYGAVARAGLPSAQIATFLSGGAKGGSTGLQWSNAIDALQGIRCNFVVPLVSRDALDDIQDGDTDPSSTYQVDAINALVKNHCIAMSKPKVKRHRIGCVSKENTFSNVRLAAQNMASFRITFFFQDILAPGADGNTDQFQPWMAAVKAAGFQAAANYKTIFNKSVNISGCLQKAGDFDDGIQSQVEDALNAGLIPIVAQPNGGFSFASDQTTYGVDNNFVYNSMQAVYVADLMALSLAESLKTAFVGESVADVSASLAVGFIKAKMAEFLNVKYTVSSTSAPGGYKSIDVQINAGVMTVQVVVVEATGIYFIPIDLTIEGISSSASA